MDEKTASAPGPVDRLVGRINLDYYACKVCGSTPDLDGIIEHGRGCYVVSEDGGGISYVELPPNLTDQRAGKSADEKQNGSESGSAASDYWADSCNKCDNPSNCHPDCPHRSKQPC